MISDNVVRLIIFGAVIALASLTTVSLLLAGYRPIEIHLLMGTEPDKDQEWVHKGFHLTCLILLLVTVLANVVLRTLISVEQKKLLPSQMHQPTKGGKLYAKVITWAVCMFGLLLGGIVAPSLVLHSAAYRCFAMFLAGAVVPSMVAASYDDFKFPFRSLSTILSMLLTCGSSIKASFYRSNRVENQVV